MESAHLASLRKGVIYFFSWLLQWIKRISQGCKGLTRPTPIICIWRWQNLSKGSQEGEICHQAGYIVVVSTEFKGKLILEQDELICCAIISSGFKETNICPFLLLEDSRPLFPLWGPQNPFLFLRDLWLLINLPSNWLSAVFSGPQEGTDNDAHVMVLVL